MLTKKKCQPIRYKIQSSGGLVFKVMGTGLDIRKLPAQALLAPSYQCWALEQGP